MRQLNPYLLKQHTRHPKRWRFFTSKGIDHALSQNESLPQVWPVPNGIQRAFGSGHLNDGKPARQKTPSQADIELTKQLQKALALVDVRVLDHIVVGMEGCESLAEKGII